MSGGQDEADILADMFGGRKTTPPIPPLPAQPAPAVSAAATAVSRPASMVRDLILAAATLAVLMGWISAAAWIIEALTSGGTITDIMTLEFAATGIIFSGLFVIAFAAKFFVPLSVSGAQIGIGAAVGLGLILGIGGQSYAVFTTWLSNHLVDPINPAARGTILMLLGGSALLLFQTAAEEYFFRGWLQPVLAKHFGAIAGISGAAIAFALLHVYGGTRDPMSVVNLALGGGLFGLLAWRTGGLAAPMAAHFAWNWSEQILFGLDPNPGIATFGALTDHDIIGSALWGGSEEGLNSSLAISFVLVALILPLALRRKSVEEPQPV
jgi:uncharacterized protein